MIDDRLENGPNLLVGVLADVLQEEYRKREGDSNVPRMLFPAFTDKFGLELHRELKSQSRKLPSYLVTDKKSHLADKKSAEEVRRAIITPQAATTYRSGANILIVLANLIAGMQDSIKGPGGVLKDQKLSSNWPFEEGGPGFLSFEHSVFDLLMVKWGVTQEEVKKKLKILVIDGLMPDLQVSPNKHKLLLDDILGGFIPVGEDELLEAFCRHCRVPYSILGSGDLNAFKDYLAEARKLCRDVYKVFQAESLTDLIGRVEKNLEQMPDYQSAPDERKAVLKQVVHAFVDGVHKGAEEFCNGNAVESCMLLYGGLDRVLSECKDGSQWLTLEVIRELFALEPKKKTATHKITVREVLTVDGEPTRCWQDNNCRTVIAPHGLKLSFCVDYEIVADDWNDSEWTIVCMSGQEQLSRAHLDRRSGSTDLEVPTEILTTYSKVKAVKFELQRKDQTEKIATVRLHLFGEQRPLVAFVVEDGDTLVGKALEFRPGRLEENREVAGFTSMVLGYQDEVKPKLLKNGTEWKLAGENIFGVWQTESPWNPASTAEGQVQVEVSYSGPDGSLKEAVVNLQLSGEEKRHFTLYEELESLVSGGKTKMGECAKRYDGSNKKYWRLGGWTEAKSRLLYLARQFELPTDKKPYLPVFYDPLNSETREYLKAEVRGDWFRLLCDPAIVDGMGFDTPSEETIRALEKYGAVRQLLIAQVGKSVELPHGKDLVSHPRYAYTPIYQESPISRRAEIGQAIENYLNAYDELIAVVKGQPEWPDQFLGLHVDSVVAICSKTSNSGSSGGGMALLGPWHPLVVARRFFLEQGLYRFAERRAEGKQSLKLNSLASLLRGQSLVHQMPICPAPDCTIDSGLVGTCRDPGWMLCVGSRFLGKQDLSRAAEITNGLEDNLGLGFKILGRGAGDYGARLVGQYLKTHPSHRSLSLHFPAATNIDEFFHELEEIEEKEVEHSLSSRVPGGVHCHAEDIEVGAVFSSDAIIPKGVKLFAYDTPEEVESTDISFLQAADEASIEVLQLGHAPYVIRGSKDSLLLSMPRLKVKKTAHGLRGYYSLGECEPPGDESGLHVTVVRVAARLQNLLNDPYEGVWRQPFGKRPKAPWLHVPAGNIDPRLVRDFLSDVGAGQTKSLWDYRINLTGTEASSHYLICETDKKVVSYIGKALPECTATMAEKMLEEMGQIGVALAAESMRSANKANGVVGTVGAARIVYQAGNPGILHFADCWVGILIPVDPFESFLGYKIQESQGDETKMCDLLALQFWWEPSNESVVFVRAVAIEAKYRSGESSDEYAKWFTQCKDTIERFKKIVQHSNDDRELPVRLALAKLVEFGLRLRKSDCELDDQQYQVVVEAVLNGGLQWEAAPLGNDSLVIMTAPKKLVSRTKYEKPKTSEGDFHAGHLIILSSHQYPCADSESEDEPERVKEVRAEMHENYFLGPEDLPGHGEPSSGETPNITPPESGPDESPDEKPEDTPTSAVSTDEGGGQGVTDEADSETPLIVELGHSKEGALISWEPDRKGVGALTNGHMLILGASGSGKTQTLKSLLYGSSKAMIPTVVLDFKEDFVLEEFRAHATLELNAVQDHGLPINPLVVPSGERLANHVFSLADSFKEIFGLGDQQAANLREAIFDTFADRGIDKREFLPEDFEYPVFSEIEPALKKTKDSKLVGRLSALFALNLFSSQEGSLEELLEKRTVVQLGKLPKGKAKECMAEFLLGGIHRHLLALGQCNHTRLIIIVDEAHRIAKLESMELLFREARAFGCAVLLSSQIPEDFGEKIWANAGTVVAMKLGSPQSSKIAAEHICSEPSDQVGVAGKLRGLDVHDGAILRSGSKETIWLRLTPFFEQIEDAGS